MNDAWRLRMDEARSELMAAYRRYDMDAIGRANAVVRKLLVEMERPPRRRGPRSIIAASVTCAVRATDRAS